MNALWKRAPGRLWSFWGMLQNHAWTFFLLSRFLEEVRVKLGLPPVQPPQQNLGGLAVTYLQGVIPSYEQPSFSLLPAAPMGDYLTEKEQEDVSGLLKLIKACCADVGLVDIGNQFDRIISYVKNAPKKDKTQFHIEEIGARITHELSSVNFFHVPNHKAQYYGNREWAFSGSIKGLDLVGEDITRAGNCYVFGENTACVFHLMRVMEHCVQALGKKLKVTAINVKTDTWHQIMLHVHGQIEKMPGGKKATAAQNSKKQKFSLAASRLDSVRIAWRNDVMHPKATYDESEALEVMSSIKAFLISISEII